MLADLKNFSCFSTDGKEVSLSDSKCKNVVRGNSFIRDGIVFNKKSITTQYLPISIYKLIKRSYLIAVIRDKILNKNIAIESKKNMNKGVDQKLMKKFSDSIVEMKKWTKNLTIFTIGKRESLDGTIPPFYKEIKKYCAENNINQFHIPTFSKEYYWLRDQHYNAAGSQKAAQFIYSKIRNKDKNNKNYD